MDKNLPKVLVLLPVILIGGTVGYWRVEEWNLLDSIYMTIITLATIGYHEVHPLTDGGKLFTIMFVIFGVAPAWGFLVSVLFKSMLEGQLGKLLGSKKMEKRLKKLKNHYIVCGFGRVGKTVCGELKNNKVPFVVIEQMAELIIDMEKAGYAYIQGSCADDENLIDAGIEKAKGLINTIADEADAVYVTLSAKQLNPEMFIMARADSQSVHNKLLRAGATRVMSPHVYAGIHMALTTLRPNVVDFMTVASDGSSNGLKVEEIAVKEGSRLAGTSIKDSGIRSELGITVIGTKKKGVEMYYNPPPDFLINEGDTLILIGTTSQLKKLEEFCSV
ncbi:MAG: potassium channel protein [candidate division Zixibacteria bacterium]|nr:potassium channel protein [candidate division Zixibacteria bacterium]